MTETLLTSVVESWWSWMAAMSFQVTVFVVVIAVVDRLVARLAWPQLLALLWLLVLVKLLVPPAVSSPISIMRLSVGEVYPANEPGVPGVTTGWHLLAFLGWLLGVFGCLTAGLCRWRKLRQEWLGNPAEQPAEWFETLLQSAAAQLKMAQAPSVCLKRGVPGPAVVGFLRPVVVIPVDLLECGTPAQIEHVLLHEFAHVQRRDPLWSLFCLGVQLVYWFHPLVWLAQRRVAALREICCDQTIARVLGEKTPEYRRTLLRLARPLLHRSALGRLGFFHQPSQLLARVQWLERPLWRRPWRQRVLETVSAGLVLACCLPMALPIARTIGSQVLSTPALHSTAADQQAAQSLPALDELQGCLRLRYVVFGMIGQQEQRDGEL